MPKVGGKSFAYTKAGQKAAKAYARAKGKKVTQAKPYSKPKKRGKR